MLKFMRELSVAQVQAALRDPAVCPFCSAGSVCTQGQPAEPQRGWFEWCDNPLCARAWFANFRPAGSMGRVVRCEICRTMIHTGEGLEILTPTTAIHATCARSDELHRRDTERRAQQAASSSPPSEWAPVSYHPI